MRGSRLLLLLLGLLFTPSSHAHSTSVECKVWSVQGHVRAVHIPQHAERVVSMPGRGHDDEPDLPARTRKPESKAAMPEGLLAQLQSWCP